MIVFDRMRGTTHARLSFIAASTLPTSSTDHRCLNTFYRPGFFRLSLAFVDLIAIDDAFHLANSSNSISHIVTISNIIGLSYYTM